MAEPVPVTIGLVAHHDFCPRRAWLEAAGENTDTHQMAVGTIRHQANDDASTARGNELRAVDVFHEDWGYTGRCDTIEELGNGRLQVIEYKSTPVRQSTEVTPAMRTQLALQVAALESMGHQVADQCIYFTEHRRRVPVELTGDDFEAARQEVEATRTVLDARSAPPPLEDSPKCQRCSHVSVCLPEERALAPVQRRIIVADPDTQVLHLSTAGSRAFLRSGRIVVVRKDEQLASVPIERVQSVVVHGNIDLSSALIRELLWRQLPLVWSSGSGRVIGWASSTNSPNGLARARQTTSPEGMLAVAAEFISAKIHNQGTLLRRNGTAGGVLDELRKLSKLAIKAKDVREVFGIEGRAAAQYFTSFSSMFKVDAYFGGRTRRPALDPVNAALNYSYALLLSDSIKAIRAAGLDPHIGFLHSSNRNKPALALDLMEEFRTPIAESVVIRAFNNGEVNAGSFQQPFDACILTEQGRKKLIAAYERRMETEFTHPTFNYKVTWRRALEVQARLVLGVLDGSQDHYVGIRVR